MQVMTALVFGKIHDSTAYPTTAMTIVKVRRVGADVVELFVDDREYITVYMEDDKWLVVRGLRGVIGANSLLENFDSASEALQFAKGYLEGKKAELDEALGELGIT